MQERASTTTTPPPSRIAAALPLATAVASTLALCLPVLSPRLQLHYRDTIRLYYPVKQYIAERLSRGELPLWDPWTDSGISLLGQISPGLLHPFTLLYPLLPFELAFKLNHLLALPIAAVGAYWLARKLGTAPWPAAVAGIVYSGSGYLVSMTASNLPYALGPAHVPAACAGLLWLGERPSAKRLLGASLLLALCNYAGEPQSALFAALIAGPCALSLWISRAQGGLRARALSGLRACGLIALWGGAALALSMPAVLPGGLRAHRSDRWSGISKSERASFFVAPARLLGLMIPRAFDDTIDEQTDAAGLTPFWEYFNSSDRASFSDAISLGVPAILLALFAFFSDRRGRWLAVGAGVFALASTGDALGVNALLVRFIPGFGLFRYAEKMIGPTSLLVALAAARGSESALLQSRRHAAALFGLCAAMSGALFGARRWLITHEPQAISFLLERGHVHAHAAPVRLLDLLEPALATSGLLALALGLIALHRARSLRKAAFSAALSCACCIAAEMTYASDLLFTANIELIRHPPPLAEELARRAGPSEGRWRFYSMGELSITHLDRSDPRLSSSVATIAGLGPQVDSLFHIESAGSYFSLFDENYRYGMTYASKANFGTLFDVRFLTTGRDKLSEREASRDGFTLVDDFWLRENPPQPRAFLVARAFRPPTNSLTMEVMLDPAFSPRTAAVLEPGEGRLVGRIDGPGPVGDANYRRLSPERIEVETLAPSDRLLVVSEHYDDGWRVELDGQPAQLLVADVCALAVAVPSGAHRVELHFWPTGLTAGIWIAALVLAALLVGVALQGRRDRPFAALD